MYFWFLHLRFRRTVCSSLLAFSPSLSAPIQSRESKQQAGNNNHHSPSSTRELFGLSLVIKPRASEVGQVGQVRVGNCVFPFFPFMFQPNRLMAVCFGGEGGGGSGLVCRIPFFPSFSLSPSLFPSSHLFSPRHLQDERSSITSSAGFCITPVSMARQDDGEEGSAESVCMCMEKTRLVMRILLLRWQQIYIYIYQKHTGIDSVTGWSGADGLDWYSFNRTISSSKARWERWITAVSKTFVYWIKGWRRRVLHCVLGVIASIIA